MNDKHAYLIIAHNEPALLKTLVSLIDDERNDIFIFIDGKADINLFKNVKTNKSNLIYTKRNNNYWGGVSQIETEYILFETAANTGHYAYYHLLSGVDLPLKSQDYIHDMCRRLNGIEFVGIVSAEQEIERRTRYYYILQKHFRCSNVMQKILVKIPQKGFVKLQQLLHVERNNGVEMRMGPQWVSITDDFCRYLISKKDEILHMFNHTFLCDEIFIPTVLWNSRFRDNIYDRDNQYHSCLRKIDWKRGYPYVWKYSDVTELLEGSEDYWFARKFTYQETKLINAISDAVKEKYNVG